ncbi:MAG: hypothetical protein ACE5EQ_09960 [Phycisphaerae bacterium]
MTPLMAKITLIGIHPLDYPDELLDAAITQQYGLIALVPDAEIRENAEIRVREALRSIVLVEMHVADRDRSMYMGDFGQSPRGILSPGDPVADQEAFLSDDGTQRIADFLDQVQSKDVRLTFYLHGYRPNLPIQTSYGPIEPKHLTPMPPRLRRVAAYQLRKE